MSDIVKIYNPANSESLTTEQIEGLQNLTNEDIKQLAKAYPNMTMQRGYLLIIDSSKPVNKQLPALSSFENLFNLRTKNGQTKYVAYNFKGVYKPQTITPVRAKKTEVLDLTDTELKSLPGFKAASELFPAMEVSVNKIKKVPIEPKK